MYTDFWIEGRQKFEKLSKGWFMENKFRSLCELCTAFGFTAFLINLLFYKSNINLYTYMCSALIALFTLLANRSSDKDIIQKGIGTH